MQFFCGNIKCGRHVSTKGENSLMAAPAAILEFVRRFQEHHHVYTSGACNETQLRRDFLDTFFAALGQDVHNTLGYAEARSTSLSANSTA